MLASLHNLHYYVNLMREIRTALDEGRFEEFRRRFKADRERDRRRSPGKNATVESPAGRSGR